MNSEKRRKILFIRYGIYIMTPISLFFLFYELLSGSGLYSLVRLFAPVALTLIYILLIRTNWDKSIFRIYLSIITVMIIVSLLKKPVVGVFWVFMIPLLYTFFLGFREGAIWFSFLSLATGLIIFNITGNFQSPFIGDFRIVFYMSYLVSGFIILGFEASRAQVLKSLKESEDLRKDLFELAGDSIMVIDLATNTIIDCNINAYKRLGYTKDEFLKLSITDFDDSLPMIRNKMDKLLMQSDIVYQESVHKRKDGSFLPVETGAKILYREGKSILLAFVRDISERKKIEDEKEEYVEKLQKAFDEIKVLQGIIPICSYCKKIRDDNGYWNQVEQYISEHTDVMFTHGICPDCRKKHFPEMEVADKSFSPVKKG